MFDSLTFHLLYMFPVFEVHFRRFFLPLNFLPPPKLFLLFNCSISLSFVCPICLAVLHFICYMFLVFSLCFRRYFLPPLLYAMFLRDLHFTRVIFAIPFYPFSIPLLSARCASPGLVCTRPVMSVQRAVLPLFIREAQP